MAKPGPTPRFQGNATRREGTAMPLFLRQQCQRTLTPKEPRQRPLLTLRPLSRLQQFTASQLGWLRQLTCGEMFSERFQVGNLSTFGASTFEQKSEISKIKLGKIFKINQRSWLGRLGCCSFVAVEQCRFRTPPTKRSRTAPPTRVLISELNPLLTLAPLLHFETLA